MPPQSRPPSAAASCCAPPDLIRANDFDLLGRIAEDFNVHKVGMMKADSLTICLTAALTASSTIPHALITCVPPLIRFLGHIRLQAAGHP